MNESFENLIKHEIWDSDVKQLKTNFHKFCLQNHPDKGGETILFAKVSNDMDICIEHFDILKRKYEYIMESKEKFKDNYICSKCMKYGHNTRDKCNGIKYKF